MSVDYGQPVRESVYSWHEGHRGGFKDRGEMESSGLYSRARGHGICVQERDKTTQLQWQVRVRGTTRENSQDLEAS